MTEQDLMRVICDVGKVAEIVTKLVKSGKPIHVYHSTSKEACLRPT